MRGYRATGKSVQGQSHIKSGKVCQDAILISCQEDIIIASIADGHGGLDYTFSDEGAKVAVETANGLFLGLFAENSVDDVYHMVKLNSDIWLPKRIEIEWKSKIQNIHEKKQRPEEPDIYKRYGSTLLTVIICQRFIFAMNIGDGDIIYANRQKEAYSSRRFLKREEFFGNETYSLCMNECWKYFSSKVIEDPAQFPDLILMCSDGYSNSFVTEDGFLQAGTDFLQLAYENGWPFIDEHIETWLRDASAQGSQDDISVIVLGKNENG